MCLNNFSDSLSIRLRYSPLDGVFISINFFIRLSSGFFFTDKTIRLPVRDSSSWLGAALLELRNCLVGIIDKIRRRLAWMLSIFGRSSRTIGSLVRVLLSSRIVAKQLRNALGSFVPWSILAAADPADTFIFVIALHLVAPFQQIADNASIHGMMASISLPTAP